jgi:membrane AbrB-like protein
LILNNNFIRAATAVAVSLAAGALFARLGTPLPWMIGPMIVVAVLNSAGAALMCPPGMRQAGQILIGTALGLYFTPVVSGEVLAHWGLLIATTLFAALLALLGGLFLMRFTGTSLTTGFFASVPGGAAEMTNLGLRHGGSPERIAIAQAVRAVLVVLVVPVALTLSGAQGDALFTPVLMPVRAEGLVALLVLSTLSGFLMLRCATPNPFMLGPLFFSIAVTVAGWEFSAMPSAFSNAGQMFLGCALGSRFSRSFLRSAPVFLLASTVSALLGIAVSAVFGTVLALLADASSAGSASSVASMILVTAPGGIAEMCITAKVLQLGVPLVTAAHVVRMVFLNACMGAIYRLGRALRQHWRQHR